jgi:hypothetical protein
MTEEPARSKEWHAARSEACQKITEILAKAKTSRAGKPTIMEQNIAEMSQESGLSKKSDRPAEPIVSGETTLLAQDRLSQPSSSSIPDVSQSIPIVKKRFSPKNSPKSSPRTLSSPGNPDW